MVTTEKIEALLKPLLDGTDLELLDLKVMGGRGRVAFHAVIDHRHRPVRVDELTAVSRQFEDRLDMEESIPREYSLDLSSPGVVRPLVHEWEFAKNVGRPFTVVLHPIPGEEPPAPPPEPAKNARGRRAQRRAEYAGLESFEAELTGVKDGTLTFANGRTIPLERVRDARVKLPW